MNNKEYNMRTIWGCVNDSTGAVSNKGEKLESIYQRVKFEGRNVYGIARNARQL